FDDLLGYRGGLLARHVLVAQCERVGDRVGDVDLLGAGGERAVQSLAVEHEGGIDGVPALRQLREDLLRAGHLRYSGGVDEACRPDAGGTGTGEPGAELGAGFRRERHLVVLEPVARADVADAYTQVVDSSAHPVTGVFPRGMLD